MRGLELKSAVDTLFKRSTSVDETTPFNLAKNKAVDHGTIPMDRTLSADDIYQTSCEKKFHADSSSSEEPKKEEDKKQGMSLLRKLCFVLSFNGGILYIVVFAWLLPCRLSPCLLAEDKWTLNLTDLQLSTNLKTNTQTKPTLIIFGHVNEDGGKLRSLTISNGKEIWNNTLPEEPLQVSCNLRGNSKMCFVTGEKYIAAVHAENGSIIWKQTCEPISTLFITQEEHNRTYLVGISDYNLHLFIPEDGQQVAIATLPCSWTVLVKVAGPWFSSNTGYVWALVCQYNDGIEAYTFLERELLDFSKKEKYLENLRVNFHSIFRKRSDKGSIDLACDVTATPDSLVLSWADMVTMVTAQAPFHHFHKTWEQRFSSPLGYVTSLTTGHFSGSKSTEIAIAVQEGSNSTIHILESKNGSSIAESELVQKRIVSIKRLPGADGERDALLIEAIKNEDSSNERPSKLESISFYMLEFEENKSALRFIATSQGHLASSLSQISKGSSNLLLASSDSTGNVILDRFIVQNKDPERNWCQDEPNSNTTVMMFLE